MQQTVERVAVDGAELKVVVQGSGEPVVLIHGSVLADEFAPLAAEPELRDYRLIRYHRLGYGGSAGAPGRASVKRDAADCRAVLAALDVEKAHVAGKSYGGAVALQLAVDAPDLVHSLALLEPALLAVPSAAQVAEAVAPIGRTYAAGDAAAAVDAFMALVWGPSWRDWVERRVPGGGTQGERDAAATFESDLPALQAWRFDAEDAQRVDVPVLLVSGTASGPLFEEIRDLVHAWFPQTEEELLADANHGFPITHPRELATALAAFLRRHPVPQGTPGRSSRGTS
jgi:pimeloyl-ACP methyl ester carboxylesterase